MKTNSLVRLIALSAAIILPACTQSSAIVTGRTRAATIPESIRIYLTQPAKYEEIGLVSATSKNRGGLSDQGKQDAAVRILKAKAAELGANGIILKDSGFNTSASVGMLSGGMLMMVQDRQVAVNGIAIYTP